MSTKKAYTIEEQIALLEKRGMKFRDKEKAAFFLKKINYYRLKGYWWDTQEDCNKHLFNDDVYFEDIMERYDFDRKLRHILFEAIERLEIALRTKMIHHLSLSHTGLWYLKSELFSCSYLQKTSSDLPSRYESTLEKLYSEFNRSQEVFVLDHKCKYGKNCKEIDAWKILEVATLGTLSKLYKLLKEDLIEKNVIANEMGLRNHRELASWFESFTYIRNIIAHHSRLWSRNMKKTPIYKLKNPTGKWLKNDVSLREQKKPFLIISCIVYMSNQIANEDKLKEKISHLFLEHPNVQIYKLGFASNWQEHPLWKPENN